MDHRKIRRTGRQKHFPIQTLTSRNKLPRARGLEKKRQTCLKSRARKHESCVRTTFCQRASEQSSNINIPPVQINLCWEIFSGCVTTCQVMLGDFTVMLACSVWGQVCEYHGV